MHGFEHAPPEILGLLSTPIKELGLHIEGSTVEKYVEQLYRELETKQLKHFRPACYLTDEWGCPSGEPVIGIPFYLADPKLAALEKAMNDLEDEREILMYLRHESGHAFNYAYELYKTPEWLGLFGPFDSPYREKYKPIPFSRRYVRHMAGWYAQKHPDEDFAETFAVWLTPRSNWRKKYEGWGALKKLRYVDSIARTARDQPPIRAIGAIDLEVREMEATIEEYYRQMSPPEPHAMTGPALDTDLADIFPRPEARRRAEIRTAADFLSEHRKQIVDRVTYWTGVRRSLIKVLVESILTRLRELKMVVDRSREQAYLVELTVYVTSLTMNYLTRGKFIHP